MSQEYKKIRKLLEKIKQINAKHEEIAHLKGENFNVFNVLDKQTDEVKTHSAMIAELLNPKGSHGMGDTFLKFFIDLINNKFNSEAKTHEKQKISTNNLEETRVYAEYYIGEITRASGGQIDILLSNNEFVICIENKINAGDQIYQLIRYHDYLKKQTKKHQVLFYLTLEGKIASDISIRYGNQDNKKLELTAGKDYHCLSYRYDILKWLEKCYQHSIELPVLRETIKQYINIIKSLTNQLISNKMEEEVFKAIVSDIESAEKINNNFNDAINYYADELKDDVFNKLKEKYPKAVIESKDDSSFSNMFVWFPKEEIHFGIESFNNKSIFQDKEGGNHLIIGLVDWRGRDSARNISHGIWLKDFQKKEICSKDKLFEMLKKYSSQDQILKSKIVTEIVGEITKYINKHLS